MFRSLIVALTLALATGLAAPAHADHLYFGGRSGGWHHHSYWGGGIVLGPVLPYYPAPYYYAPPPVVYAPPPVIYQIPPMEAAQASQTFTDSAGRSCREFSSTALIDGRYQPIYGTACLMPDGAWRVVR